MPKLGDIVTYVTHQGQPRMAFVSTEVVEPSKEEDEPAEGRKARKQREADEQKRVEAEQKQHDEQLAQQTEEAKAAHAEAEARAGGPIQRVALVTPEALSPVPALPPVEVEEEEPTGPELTLHVLLHGSDTDASLHGSMAVYSGVKHSDKGLPNTWH